MTWITLGISAGTLFVMAVVLSYILGWANKAFEIEVDPRVEACIHALPGANCGGCGYVGCGDYAEAVVSGAVGVDKCTVGGESCAKSLADILGVKVEQTFPFRPIVHCGATYNERLGRSPYLGEKKCASANLVSGIQGCTYGCLGFGDCEEACAFDAIAVADGLPVVDYEKCVGCGACAKACPRRIITINPFKAERMLAVTCSNLDSGPEVRKVCTVGCIGCKACEKSSGLFKVQNNLSSIDYDKYSLNILDNVELAVKKCPRKRLVFVGKPSSEDMAQVADQELPGLIRAEGKSTVEELKWRG
ncbi:MAG: RnfABCDGE type electron transport complex subunit B [Proteobacteria bacterium]|nr:RnfABCDGE type electron transport complex subunit B [Pseudomonadota bacterium]MBU4470451.1 RnfABCDGE type electron transport complex subunit B [Pseudomonadota bacterium]MCG2753504.1 RnfABCDGE type electron transport complex subunit B [Desulfobacteraceae bacterium]